MWLVAVFLALIQPSPGTQASRVVVGAPTTIAAISIESAQGVPSRLSWSPDGQTLYIRFTKRDVWGNERDGHFLLPLSTGQIQGADAEPPWAAAYWAWKSALVAPGVPSFRVDVETREERKTATGVVSAGSMAQSGGDPSLGAVLGPQGQAIAQSSMQAQMVTTTTFKMKGELIAEFVNQPATQGSTYSWGPAGFDAAVVVDRRHRLVLIDAGGHKRQLTEPGEWTLPAWSPDGTRLAAVRAGTKRRILVQLFTLSR